jgi:hypothetical protein
MWKIGPTLNMDGPIPQAYFFQAGLANQGGMGFFAGFGKRVPLASWLTFRPNIEWVSGAQSTFYFNILSVSAFF